MPPSFFLAPDGRRVDFDEAPAWFDHAGIMPSYAVDAIIRKIKDDGVSFHVRPSDVNPDMTCRRQRVWQTNHEYGVDPLQEESLMEGNDLHNWMRTQEIHVPGGRGTRTTPAGLIVQDEHARHPVCGVPMRGYIDFLDEVAIEDLKNQTPFWASKFAPKDSLDRRPITYIWGKEERDREDIAKWQLQLSIYNVLLVKSGEPSRKLGRVWRRWLGVRADAGRYRKFEFPLLSEAELEAKVGPWMRELQAALDLARTDPEAGWKLVSPDGRGFIGSKGNMWACDRCGAKEVCFKQDQLVVF